MRKLIAIVSVVLAALIFVPGEAAATGIWSVQRYVDEFGDPTNSCYMLGGPISGQFSNSATNNSRLTVKFLVNDSTSISIMLWEYGSHQVKAYTETNYTVSVKTDDGMIYQFKAHNLSDRLHVASRTYTVRKRVTYAVVSADSLKVLNDSLKVLWASSSDEARREYNHLRAIIRSVGDGFVYFSRAFGLHNLLLKYSTLKVYIAEDDTPLTTYNFKVNANGYTATYKKLMKLQQK